jgi:hypothetical protein
VKALRTFGDAVGPLDMLGVLVAVVPVDTWAATVAEVAGSEAGALHIPRALPLALTLAVGTTVAARALELDDRSAAPQVDALGDHGHCSRAQLLAQYLSQPVELAVR